VHYWDTDPRYLGQTENFLAQSPSLIAYINRYRGEPVPLDYRVEFFEYDWTINAQTGRARSARP
jgi:hypothetical protein